jgi:Sulfotransferase family
MLSSEPFFIFGAPRSGTSLLSRMLDSHPRLAVPFETHFFRHFGPLLPYYGDLSQAPSRQSLIDDILASPTIRYFDPPLERERVLAATPAPTFGGVVDAVMASWAAQQGKARWGEKTPMHAFDWPLIWKSFPGARVIHLIRDGRDVAISVKRARHGPKTIYAAAQQWSGYLAQMRMIRASIAEDSFLEVSYEDLVRAPRHVLRTICRFLEEDFCEQMLHFHERTTRYPTDLVNEANLHRPVLVGNAGKWRGEMSAGDIRIVEAVAGRDLRALGYPLAGEPRPLSRTEHLFRRYVEHPPRRSIARLRDRQGQAERLRLVALRARVAARSALHRSRSAWREMVLHLAPRKLRHRRADSRLDGVAGCGGRAMGRRSSSSTNSSPRCRP